MPTPSLFSNSPQSPHVQVPWPKNLIWSCSFNMALLPTSPHPSPQVISLLLFFRCSFCRSHRSSVSFSLTVPLRSLSWVLQIPSFILLEGRHQAHCIKPMHPDKHCNELLVRVRGHSPKLALITTSEHLGKLQCLRTKCKCLSGSS